jgi:hypothetical protein
MFLSFSASGNCMSNTPSRQDIRNQNLNSPRIKRCPAEGGIRPPKQWESSAQGGLTTIPTPKKKTIQKTCFAYPQQPDSEKDRAERCSAMGGGDSARAEGMEVL